MKKTRKPLELHRETVQRLGDGALRQPVGGIFPMKKQDPPPPTAVVCTATCVGCLPGL